MSAPMVSMLVMLVPVPRSGCVAGRVHPDYDDPGAPEGLGGPDGLGREAFRGGLRLSGIGSW